jgi:3D (Asp-Asp-Asp) domain-containing protein
MTKFALSSLALTLVFATGCAHKQTRSSGMRPGSVKTVRTTAYAACEGSPRNAVGGRLSNGPVKSAASDWSRFPLGTRFKLKSTGEVFEIDDYGSALVGTDTIDLFKPSRRAMNQWGVRRVDVEIVQWGCPKKSLQVLVPRNGNRSVRAMVTNLQNQS